MKFKHVSEQQLAKRDRLVKGLTGYLEKSKTVKLSNDVGLTLKDKAMFNRIMLSLEHERKYGVEYVYQEHFALKPGWRPNRK